MRKQTRQSHLGHQTRVSGSWHGHGPRDQLGCNNDSFIVTMKTKLKEAFMKTAETFAELSHARRLHVGAIIVKDDRVISIGYNGMPAGWDNNCEDKVFNTRFTQQKDGTWIDPLTYKVVDIDEHYPFVATSDVDDSVIGRYRLKTKPEVLHAERNALDKLAKGNEGGLGAIMFITHAPCLECAKSIYGAGISHVFYRDSYRSEDGIQFLTKCGVSIEKLSIGDK